VPNRPVSRPRLAVHLPPPRWGHCGAQSDLPDLW
jgi:hypothetical protein